MEKLKKNKYVALLIITILVVGIIGLVSFGKTDKYEGLVRVKNSNIESKLLSSVGNATLSNDKALGNSTVEYLLSFTLDEIQGVEKRDAIIRGSLSTEEAAYAKFKEITGTGVTCTLSDNGKNIEVRFNDVKLGVEKRVKLKVVITNAPNGFTVHPNISVGEATGDYTSFTTDTITVETNTIEGIVKDENDLPVSDIEVIAKQNGREVKRTYADTTGKYVFTDLEAGTYSVEIDEELYELVSKEQIDVTGSANLNIKVKHVEPYQIETHKYITSLKLIVDGKEHDYTYEDRETVLETIRKANSLSGEITYKLVVQNTGEKRGTITRVADEASEGLTLKSGNNGWEEVDGVYYYRPLEGVNLDKNEIREVGLVLSITDTNEAKTYINKMTATGEIYEKVVYILDGEKYKEEEVLEGDKIVEPVIGGEFSGWYTDTNKTNKYNFDLPVKKDLILYGYTNTKMCTVTFIDFGTVYDRQTILCGTTATTPTDPEHEGYKFDKWLDPDEIEFDPERIVEEDETYTSKNDLIEYTITYRGLTNAEETALQNPIKYTIESETITLNNPGNRYDGDNDLSQIFVGWTGTGISTETMNAMIPHGSTGNREYIANWIDADPDVYPITYILNGGSLEEGKTNPTSYTKFTETFTLNNPSKEGYRFIGWTGTDLEGNTITVTVPQGSRGAREYTANYEAIVYNITYELDGGALEEGKTNPLTYTIETPTFTLNNPSKIGHDFTGWTGTDVQNESITVSIPQGSIGDREFLAHYQKKKYTVTYMDEGVQFAKETVEYMDTATAPDPSPTKAHNIFLKWLLNGEEYIFSTPVTEDLILESSYEEVLPPTITHTPDLPEWTNQFVVVTVNNPDHPEYSYAYSVDGGEISDYEDQFKVYDNGYVTAHSLKNGVASVDTIHYITNIDKIAPTIDNLTLDYATIDSAKVDFENHDDESGLKEVKIYLDDTYITSFMYSENVNDHKFDSYTFNNLTDDTTYTVKLVSYDYAGNISNARELEITTEKRQDIVARIITVGNSPLNEEDYIYLPTLRAGLEYNQDGINCLTTQCTIQMLKSVNETNEVLGGQVITLDLNGQTVNGIGNYTIRVNENADFTLIDSVPFDPEQEEFNEANHNALKNTTGTAIINQGTLTLGEGNSGEDVSIYLPYVLGAATGVDTVNGTFNFYDGRIKGSVAISGEVDDTPFMHNADVMIKTEDEQPVQVSYLKVLADVEARIGSKYYTRIATAVEEAKNGTYVDILSTNEFMDSFDKIGSYGFIKEGNFLVNENTESNSTAKSSFVLDLREYQTDQLLTIATNRQSDDITPQSNAQLLIYEGTDTSGSVIVNYSPEKGENIREFQLEAGKKYYVQLLFNIYSANYNEKLYITDLSLRDYIEEVPSPYEDLETVTISKNYGFDYDPETKTYRSNNQYTSNTTAFSYYEIDLTGTTGDKELIISASLSAVGTSHRGAIYVKEDNSIESSLSSNSLLYISRSGGSTTGSTYGPITVSKVLQSGKKYYVQFYYAKSSDTVPKSAYEGMGVKDQFIINSIDVLDNYTTYGEENVIEKIVPGDNFSSVNYSSYGKGLKTGGTYSGKIQSYLEVDLRSSSVDKYINVGYVGYRLQGDQNYYAMITESEEIPELDIDKAFLYGTYDNSTRKNTTGVLTKGKKYYVHFVYDPADNFDTYYYFTFAKATLTSSPDLASSLVTPGDYGFTPGRSVSPQSSDYTHSYIQVDLTGDESEKFSRIDFYSYYAFYILVNNSPELPQNLLESDYINPNTGSSYYGPVLVNLIPNEVNYIHFILPPGSSGSTELKSYTIEDGRSLDILNQLTKSKGAAAGFDSYRTSDPIAIYPSVTSTVVDSYVEFDLQNSSTDVELTVKATMPYGTGYAYLSDSKRAVNISSLQPTNNYSTNSKLLYFFDYDNGYYYVDGSSSSPYYTPREYKTVVSRGKKYYLHFGCYTTDSYYKNYINYAYATPVSSYNTKVGKQRYIVDPQGGGDEELPDDLAIDSFDNNNLRYIGSSPSNYVRFNGELWRIVGIYNVEDENGVVKPRIKIVRNDSIGNYSWDTSNSTQYTPGTNDWTISDIMRLLNEGYDSDTVNNSLYWNKSSGDCYTGTNSTSSCDFSSTGLSAESRAYIEKVKWNIGKPNTPSSASPTSIYNIEKQDTWLGKVGLLSLSDTMLAMGDYAPVSDSSPKRDTCINSETSTYGACYTTNNWIPDLYSRTDSWLMTGSSLDPPGSEVFLFYSSYINGNINLSYNAYKIHPAVYLNSKVQITGGTGTSGNPYTLSLGSSDNDKMNNYYGLIPSGEEEDTGEVIDYETDDYENIKQSPIYGFEYDEETGYYISNNAEAGASTAESYIVIDRTTELEPIDIKMTYDKSSYNYSDGKIVLLEGSYDDNINIKDYNSYSSYRNWSAYSESTETIITLEAGKKYYMYFGFYKAYSDMPNETYRENMRVKLDGLGNSTPSTIVTKYVGEDPVRNEDADTIQMLKDISMPSGLNIVETKNVVLDLNGYSLSTSVREPVITNNGSLKIIDSKGGGSINTSDRNTGVLNNAKANLIFDAGTINVYDSWNRDIAGIDNYGTVGLNNSTINVIHNYGYGIINRTTGDILDGNGTINFTPETSSSSDSPRAIYTMSTVDEGFSGYHLYNLIDSSSKSHTISNIVVETEITDYSNEDHVYSNIEANSFRKQNGANNLLIEDSDINNLHLYYYQDNQGYTHINTITDPAEITVSNTNVDNIISYISPQVVLNIENGSEVENLNGNKSGYYNIKDSSVENAILGETSNEKTLIVDNSEIGTLTTSIISTLNDSTIGNIVNKNAVTITGNSVVDDGITNGDGWSSANSLTIGVDDGEVDTEYPKIIGEAYAITGKNTTINYYDGSLTGNKHDVITSTINDIPDNYSMVSTINGTKETIYLSNEYVCEINGVGYNTLQDAVDSITTNDETEIVIIKDFNEVNQVAIPENRNIKVDFNGHTIYIYSEDWLTNNGNLDLYDSQSASVNIESISRGVINNTGVINYAIKTNLVEYNTIENTGTINLLTNGSLIKKYKSNYDSTDCESIFNNNGIININGVYLEDISMVNYGTLDITTGTFGYFTNSDKYANNRFTNYGSMTIRDGYFSKVGITNNAGGVLDIKDGTFENPGITNYSNLTIEGGTYKNSTTKYNNIDHYIVTNNSGGTADISDITVIDSSSNSLRLNLIKNSGTATIEDVNGSFAYILDSLDGTIKFDNTSLTGYVYIAGGSVDIEDSSFYSNEYGATIFITREATLNIDNSTITNELLKMNSSYNYVKGSGIEIDAGQGAVNLNITSGKVTSKYGNAIQNRGTGEGTIIFGELGGDVSVTSPEITGKEYGFISYNPNTSVYFYDGIFNGAIDKSFSGTMTETEPNYDVIIIRDEENMTEMQFLSNDILVRNIDKEIDYSVMQTAIDEADSGDELQLLRNYVTSSNSSSIVIPEGKTITLDMNLNNIIQNSTSNPLFVNNGTLTIKDTLVEMNFGAGNNTISINGTNYNINSDFDYRTGVIINNTTNTSIVNNGTITINGLVITSPNENSSYIIKNSLGATANISEFIYNSSLYKNTYGYVDLTIVGVINNEGTMNIDNYQISCFSDDTTPTIINTGTFNSEIGTISEPGKRYRDQYTYDYNTNLINQGSATLKSTYFRGYVRNSSDLNIKNTSSMYGLDSTSGHVIMEDGTIYSNSYKKSSLTLSNDTVFDMSGGTVSYVASSGTSTFKMTGGKINGTTAITASENSKTIIEGGTIESSNGIVSSSSENVVIGKNDGTVSDSNPYIKSNNIGIRGSSNVDFYDGLVETTSSKYIPIDSEIDNVATGYFIIIEDNKEYLTTDNTILNVDTNEEYNDIGEAISEARNNDTLKVLKGILLSGTDVTIPSNKSITIDLNDKNIYCNDEFNFINNGTLSLTTTTLNGSKVIFKKNNKFMENNGTLNIDNLKIQSDIVNSGTVNHNSGTLNGSITNTGTYIMGDVSIDILKLFPVNDNYFIEISNSGTLTIQNVVIGSSENESLSSYYIYPTVFNNTSAGNIVINYMKMFEDEHDAVYTVGAKFFKNEGLLTINDGIFNMYRNGSSGANVKEYERSYIYNFGTVNVNGGVFDTIGSKTDANFIANFPSSTAKIKDATILYEGIALLNGDLELDNVTINPDIQQRIFGGYARMSGDTELPYSLTIKNSTLDNIFITSLSSSTIASSRNNYITNSTINGRYESYQAIITDSTINGYVKLGGTENHINNSTITSSDNNAAVQTNYVTTKIYVENNSSITSNTGAGMSGGTIYIDQGCSVTSTNGTGIFGGTLYLGTKDGTYDSTSPVISGKDFGVNGSKIYFYDGVINTEGVPIAGDVMDYETGYNKVNVTSNDGILSATLGVQGEDERVIVMNNVNYTSLQAAVNAAPDNVSTDMVLYTNYTLTENVVVPANKIINFYLNGSTITYDSYIIDTTSGSTFNIVSGAPSNLSGSLINGDNDSNNIIIYQMEDGNSLSELETYKVYRLMDGQYMIVMMSEEELGTYKEYGTIEKLRTIKGKLYLNGLKSGTYKLVSNTNRELDFIIEDDSISSNIRINNSITSARVQSSSIATLILTFSTGIIRTPWMILILLLAILVTLGIIVIKKKTAQKEVI